VYPGPIGSVLTPLFHGLKYAAELPFASTLCGHCTEICPVKIEIHHLLLHLRNRIVKAGISSIMEKQGFRIWKSATNTPGMYRFMEKFLRFMQKGLPGGKPPYVPGWSTTRDFPGLSPKSFHEWWIKKQD
jgi:L-lactate dehydrogenase complex protein LldF